MNVGDITKLYAPGAALTNFSVQELQMMIDQGWAGGPVPAGFYGPRDVDSAVS
jgi:hypothetical protein